MIGNAEITLDRWDQEATKVHVRPSGVCSILLNFGDVAITGTPEQVERLGMVLLNASAEACNRGAA